MKPTGIFLIAALAISFAACNNDQSSSTAPGSDSSNNTNAAPSLKQEGVSYSGDNTTLKGYVVYDENKKGKRPAVIVVHEWWGMNDYPRMRARKLAELGYFAMAVNNRLYLLLAIKCWSMMAESNKPKPSLTSTLLFQSFGKVDS